MTVYGQFLSPKNFYNSKIECYVRIECQNFAIQKTIGKEIINTLQNKGYLKK